MTDVEAYFDQLCLGNKDAREFCCVFHHWVHWIDDAVDEEKRYSVEETARISLEAVFTFSENPFFQQHKLSLIPLIVQSVLAWESSQEWEKKRGDYRDYVASQVMKSYYHEVFWHVALIVGGWSHARETLKQHRRFDYDELPELSGTCRFGPDKSATNGLDVPLRELEPVDAGPGGPTSCGRCPPGRNANSQT